MFEDFSVVMSVGDFDFDFEFAVFVGGEGGDSEDSDALCLVGIEGEWVEGNHQLYTFWFEEFYSVELLFICSVGDGNSEGVGEFFIGSYGVGSCGKEEDLSVFNGV